MQSGVVSLLEWNIHRASRCTDAGCAVLHLLVRDHELAEIMTYHLRFDVNSLEFLAIVDEEVQANHFGQDNHISTVGFDGSRAFGLAATGAAH